MKTLEEIINERLIIEDDGYTDGRVSIQSIKDICILAQQQALKNASESCRITIKRNFPKAHSLEIISYISREELGETQYYINKQSILNEQNIVK